VDIVVKQEAHIQRAILDRGDMEPHYEASPSALEPIKKNHRLPYPQISKEFPGKVDTSTPYVMGKIVSRLEMDSRWALARSVRALVAERDALKEKLVGNFNSATGSGAA
jgi:hypothetical protein